MTIDLPGGFRLELGNTGRGPGWLACLGLGIGVGLLLAWLSRPERAKLTRARGLALLGLRLLAAAMLVVTLLEPAVTRVGTVAVPARVLVAIDVSESMQTTDPGGERMGDGAGSPLPRREIARRLLAGPGGLLDRLARDHTPDIRTFARSVAPASLATLEGVIGRRPEPTETGFTDWRPILAEAAASGPDAGDVNADPVVAVVLLSDGRFNSPLAPGAGTGDPSGRVEDEADLLRRLAARRIPVYPVLIGSTTPPPDLAVAALKAPPAVYQGDTAPVQFELKLDGFMGREVSVSLSRTSAPGESPWSRRQTLRVPAGDGSSTGRMRMQSQVPMDRPGDFRLTVAVAATGDGKPAREARMDNNERTVAIRVSPERARVLIVDSEPRWELRYLRNALARDPRVAVEAVVLHAPGLPGTPRLPDGLNPRPGASGPDVDLLPFKAEFPQVRTENGRDEEEPLLGFDTIILGDVGPDDLPPRSWKRLEAYVGEGGGTLIIAPGPHHWPGMARRPGGRGGEAADALGALLPVIDPQPVPVPDDPGSGTSGRAHPGLPAGPRLVRSPAALGDPTTWPMFQLGRDPGPGGPDSFTTTAPGMGPDAWDTLPGLPWLLAGRPKPGATALAMVPVGPSARESESQSSTAASTVMAAHHYGLGKVFWLGTDGTWRWRYRAGDLHHHRFWGQVVRWAAVTGKLGAGNARVRFGPLSPQVTEGQEVVIEARISDRVPGLPIEPLLAARIVRAGPAGESPPLLIPLRPLAGRRRVFQGRRAGLEPGSYLVSLEAPGQDQALGLGPGGPGQPAVNVQAYLEVVAAESSERIDLAASPRHLQRLATATGGRLLSGSEAGSLINLLRPMSRTLHHPRIRREQIWDHPLNLLGFATILTLAWLLRRRWGLS